MRRRSGSFLFGQYGLANVTLLNNANGTYGIDTTATHYGTVTNISPTGLPTDPGQGQWLNTGAIPGYSPDTLASYNTAQSRYTLAAYLVTQYQGFDTTVVDTGRCGPAGDLGSYEYYLTRRCLGGRYLRPE